MSVLEPLVLSDKEIIPTDEYIFSIIGEKRVLWRELLDYMSDNYKDSSGGWRYYKDGNQWLFKMERKKKTVFWAGIMTGTFRVTFYFGDKAENLIYSGDLSQTLKDEFKTGKRYGKIRAISLKMSDQKDVESVKKLVAIKMKIK
jgi:hypothetical protein